ncbi:MAG TPA: FeoC-like transcriptional regulator [Anaerolineae bacterium]
MFDKLESILKRGGSVTTNQIARELNTTPALVSEMIAHLSRAGLLKQMEASCISDCEQCKLFSDCNRSPQARVWQVSER